jgi:hypothetical protein
MPFRLKNLRVDEISSVDRGAARGARVLITKSASATNERVSPMSATDLLKMDRAVGVSVAKNISKLMDEHGMTLDQAATLLHRYQKDGGYSVRTDDDDSPKRREDASHGESKEVEPDYKPSLYPASASNADAPVRDSALWEGEVRRLMAEHGLSRAGAIAELKARETKKFDVAMTKQLRIEKAARGW